MPDSLLPLPWHLLASSVPSVLLRFYQRRMLQEGTLNIPRGSIVLVSVSSVLFWVCFSRETVEAVVVVFSMSLSLSVSIYLTLKPCSSCMSSITRSPHNHIRRDREKILFKRICLFNDREWLRYSTSYWLVRSQHENNLENIDSKRMHKVFLD